MSDAAAKKRDRQLAKEAAYRHWLNPFKPGTRVHRYFIKARQHVENMDALFRDLEMVYGPIGQKCSDRGGHQ